jgi:hypothetical protein
MRQIWTEKRSNLVRMDSKPAETLIYYQKRRDCMDNLSLRRNILVRDNFSEPALRQIHSVTFMRQSIPCGNKASNSKKPGGA